MKLQKGLKIIHLLCLFYTILSKRLINAFNFLAEVTIDIRSWIDGRGFVNLLRKRCKLTSKIVDSPLDPRIFIELVIRDDGGMIDEHLHNPWQFPFDLIASTSED